jgi:hypothetical protein
MRRIKGIAKAVVTIAGAISLSSPLLAASANGMVQKTPLRSKDRPGIVNQERICVGSATGSSTDMNLQRHEKG